MVKVTSLIVKAGSGLRFSFGVRAWTEMEIWCVEGIHRLKLVSHENNSGFKGLMNSYGIVYHSAYLITCVDNTIRKTFHCSFPQV